MHHCLKGTEWPIDLQGLWKARLTVLTFLKAGYFSYKGSVSYGSTEKLESEDP